jgi:hypothetical protein
MILCYEDFATGSSTDTTNWEVKELVYMNN